MSWRQHHVVDDRAQVDDNGDEVRIPRQGYRDGQGYRDVASF